jgi:hypothetical protein
VLEPRPIAPGLFVVGPEGPRLLAARCAVCAELHFPAEAVCPYCAATDVGVVPAGPEGRLKLFTAVLTRPPGYRGDIPYGFGVVELADGLEVITRLTEPRLDRLRAGLRVRLVVEPLFTDEDGRPVLSYAFRPEET